MPASIVEVSVPASQLAEPSEIVSQDIDTAPNSTALATSGPKLAKNFASLGKAEEAAKAFGYDKLDSAATKKEFGTLDGELNKRKDDIAKARVTLEEATPYLARMQALLSQRGADRKKVLRDAKVPTWSKWAKAYAKELNYTVRTLQARIKELREGKKGGAGDSHPTPTHYTKAQTDEMVSTCKLAIKAKKASEAGRPVDAILAKVKMDGKRLREVNETAQQLPDYRKCTEQLLSVIEKYAKGEVPAAKIIEVANDIRKEVTRKQADASLTEAARAGKKGKATLLPPHKSAAPLPKAHPPTKAGGNSTFAPVAVDAKPEQAEDRAMPAKTPDATNGATVTSGRVTQVAAESSPAAKGEAAPKAQPKAASTGKRNTAVVATTPTKEAGAASKHPEKPTDNGSKTVYEAFPGGPKVLEVVIPGESSSDPPRLKYYLCAGAEKRPYPTLDGAKAACDKIAERLAQEQRGKEAERQTASVAASVSEAELETLSGPS